VSTLLILFWGEILPKTLAARNPVLVAAWLAGATRFLTRCLSPITWMLNRLSTGLLGFLGLPVTRSEFLVTLETLGVAADLGREQGTLEEVEHSMIMGALDTHETRVREIMTPRPDVIRLSAAATVREAVEAVVTTGYSRLPVWESTVDNIVGIVGIKDLLPLIKERDLAKPVREILRPPFFVPETQLVSDLLRQMRSRGTHLAVVVDEFGGTAGVVTLEDVVEEVVGEIADEFDVIGTDAEAIDGGYLVSARLPVKDLNERFDLDLPVREDVDTVGGLFYSIAGQVPRLGDSVEVEGWHLIVEEIKGSRIMKVRLREIAACREPGRSSNGAPGERMEVECR